MVYSLVTLVTSLAVVVLLGPILVWSPWTLKYEGRTSRPGDYLAHVILVLRGEPGMGCEFCISTIAAKFLQKTLDRINVFDWCNSFC